MHAVVERLEADGSTWEVARPPAERAPLLHAARVLGYDERSGAPVGRDELPQANVVVILGFGERVRVDGTWRSSFAAGLIGRPSSTFHEGRQGGIQLDLPPLVASALLGVAPRDLAGSVAGLDELGDPVLATLPERLADLATWGERFALLDAVLGARLEAAPAPRPEVVEAWRRLVASGGGARVADLARDLGWSRRHLSGAFADQVGLPPKAVARILRFQRAVGLLGRRATIADVAAECGYADHSHLVHDVRDLAGCTPGELVARGVTNLHG